MIHCHIDMITYLSDVILVITFSVNVQQGIPSTNGHFISIYIVNSIDLYIQYRPLKKQCYIRQQSPTVRTMA